VALKHSLKLPLKVSVTGANERRAVNSTIRSIAEALPRGEPTTFFFLMIIALGWKLSSKHGISTLGLLSRGLVLDDVPVLGQDSVFDSQDVDDNPVRPTGV